MVQSFIPYAYGTTHTRMVIPYAYTARIYRLQVITNAVAIAIASYFRIEFLAIAIPCYNCKQWNLHCVTVIITSVIFRYICNCPSENQPIAS